MTTGPLLDLTEIREQSRRDSLLRSARETIKLAQVVDRDGHFEHVRDIHVFHGKVWANAHRLFHDPTFSWPVVQGLVDVLPDALIKRTVTKVADQPDVIYEGAEVVAGPITGGALLAKEVAALLSARLGQTQPSTKFAPIYQNDDGVYSIKPFYESGISGRNVILVDDVRLSGNTIESCAEVIKIAGGKLIAMVLILDSKPDTTKVGGNSVPTFSVDHFDPGELYKRKDCPLCKEGRPITKF